MTKMPDPYHGFRFPAEIISHAVWSLRLPVLGVCRASRQCGGRCGLLIPEQVGH